MQKKPCVGTKIFLVKIIIWSCNAIRQPCPRANHEAYPLQQRANAKLIEFAKKIQYQTYLLQRRSLCKRGTC